MAENESLDLGTPGGQRWNHVHDAVRKRRSPDEVAHKMTRKLPAALRKAFKEFAEMGVPFQEFLAHRKDAKALERFVRKCQGHEYAHLFKETSIAEAHLDDQQLIGSFLNGVVDKVADQITQDVSGSADWPDITSVRDLFTQVRRHLEPDLKRIARKLAKDPNWVPKAAKRKTDDADNQTQDLLNMSMLGMKK